MSSVHVGRAWSGHVIEDTCPCPQEPCGLVDPNNASLDCPHHPIGRAKSVRQGHDATACPGPVTTSAYEDARARMNAEQVEFADKHVPVTAQSSPDLPASLQRTTRTTGGEDVYQAAAVAMIDAINRYRPAPLSKVDVLGLVAFTMKAGALYPVPFVCAAVDRAVELTEQRVRAEMTEQLRVTSVAANLPADVDPVAYLEKRLNFAWSEIDRIGSLAWDLAAEGGSGGCTCVINKAAHWVDLGCPTHGEVRS